MWIFVYSAFVSENSGQTQSRDNPSVKAEVEQHSALLFASVIWISIIRFLVDCT